MKLKAFALCLSLPALCLLTACDNGHSAPKGATATEPPAEVKTARPFRGPITRSVTLPGEIKAYQQATLYAKVAGYLKAIPVDKGDSVKEGDLLADIEAPELAAELTRFKAEVAAAELDYNRLSESQKKAPDLVVPQAVDNARAKLDVAKAEVERTETLLHYARITAPFSGIITRRMADPGAFIPAATSGNSARNAEIVTLADFNRVRVQVAVPEIEAALVTVGQPVKLAVEGLPGRMFEGKVTRFSYALDEASKTMLAEAELPNPKLELRPGMYATVQIGIEQKPDVLLVPAGALATEKAGTSLFLLIDGKAKKTKVRIGFNDGRNVEIVSGLQPEQTVILVDKTFLNDGQSVKVTEAK